ncbi:MAG: hypothetical protein M3176_02585 [Chloroflexota bacterium]|nr:hypothetical protein [Chloroflexota bacterium]
MTDSDVIVAPAREEIVTTYPLGGDATPLVQIGETVVSGDVLARGNRPPVFVAYAATLGLSITEAATAIERHDGEDYRAGTLLGTRRVGLRTRSVSVSVGGSLHALPNSGALAIRDETGSCDVQARYGGIVRAVTEREIVVVSEVVCCGYALVDGVPMRGTLHVRADMLSATVTRDSVPPLRTKNDCTVVAHIADPATLIALRSHRQGTLLVGSVSENVAWHLASRAQDARQGWTERVALVVLHGVGDADAGIAAATMFGDLDGASVLFDRLSRSVAVSLPSASAESVHQSSQRSRQTHNLHAIRTPQTPSTY